jgi:hypothetical protein
MAQAPRAPKGPKDPKDPQTPRDRKGPQDPQTPQAPRTVRVAGAVQAAESLLLLAATVLAAVDTAAGKSYQAASGIALTIIGLVTVGLLLLVALGLARGRPWTRTPALLTQLFTGIIGIYLVQGSRMAWGIPALALAAAGLAALFAPPSTQALARGPSSPPGSGRT